ncbi:hypothetical protein DFH09DRAFT_1089520 [Mycena vulgaris]|nr:hypothetical protein DFH09DRAFT_1089520 [Mycena vulgaris]
MSAPLPLTNPPTFSCLIFSSAQISFPTRARDKLLQLIRGFDHPPAGYHLPRGLNEVFAFPIASLEHAHEIGNLGVHRRVADHSNPAPSMRRLPTASRRPLMTSVSAHWVRWYFRTTCHSSQKFMCGSTTSKFSLLAPDCINWDRVQERRRPDPIRMGRRDPVAVKPAVGFSVPQWKKIMKKRGTPVLSRILMGCTHARLALLTRTMACRWWTLVDPQRLVEPKMGTIVLAAMMVTRPLRSRYRPQRGSNSVTHLAFPMVQHSDASPPPSRWSSSFQPVQWIHMACSLASPGQNATMGTQYKDPLG